MIATSPMSGELCDRIPKNRSPRLGIPTLPGSLAEAELMGARLAITLVVGMIAAYITYFVLTYIGTDMTNSFAPALIIIGIAAAFAVVAFVRS